MALYNPEELPVVTLAVVINLIPSQQTDRMLIVSRLAGSCEFLLVTISVRRWSCSCLWLFLRP